MFSGIKWAIKCLKFLNNEIKIKNNQNGNAIVNEKIICLDDEKM